MNPNVKNETRWRHLLYSAEKIFAEKGYHDATISDIAKAAELSEGTIYEYFSSKEDLFFSIAIVRTSDQEKEIDFILEHITGAESRLRAYLYHYMWFWQNYKDYASISLLNYKQNRKFVETEAHTLAQGFFHRVPAILKEGIESGEFIGDIDITVVTSMVIGTADYIATNALLYGVSRELTDYVDSIIKVLIKGIKTE